jgi:hypothetical protein
MFAYILFGAAFGFVLRRVGASFAENRCGAGSR